MGPDNRSPEEVLNDAGYFRQAVEANGKITYATEHGRGADFAIKVCPHTRAIEVNSREYPGAPPLGIWVSSQTEYEKLPETLKEAVQFAVGGEARQEMNRVLANNNTLMRH